MREFRELLDVFFSFQLWDAPSKKIDVAVCAEIDQLLSLPHDIDWVDWFVVVLLHFFNQDEPITHDW